MLNRIAVFVVLCIVILGAFPLHSQSPTATVNGQVRDATGAVVLGADVQLINDRTNVRYPAKTNRDGIYSVTDLPPGTYHIQVSKPGFKTIVKPDIVLNVLDARAINFDLPVGAVSQTVTVEGGTPLVDTQSATVSTVVDRQFAENLPLNGRSFQTLINLTPGVVVTASSVNDGGQFSVNGQRASSNYWMVDGVGANIGAAPSFVPGNGTGGALFGFSAQGGTNSLVSVDAMQEFRIQTSTYAPEFGRTPGGQISIVTRSGTNQLHATVFDYFRNDVLDANDWFADHLGLPKPEERQNDFGGTFSGPILRNRTFFFFSYEGLRLRLPQVAQTAVPDLPARQSANAALQPFLNAFPQPNGPQAVDGSGNPIAGAAQFNKSFSNKSTLDAYSLRIDHKVSSKVSLFGRYNYSPSENLARGSQGSALSQLSPSDITTQTATGGATWTISPTLVNDLRLNYSRSNAASSQELDGFGGAASLSALPLPGGFTSQNASLSFFIESLFPNLGYIVGKTAHNLQRQVNLVENLSWQKGSHSLKFGVDYRRLTPVFGPPGYTQQDYFNDVPSAETGSLLFYVITASRSESLLFRNVSVFAQDTWRVAPRLTLTYGLRWDVDVAPATTSGPSFPAVTNFNLNNLSMFALAPAGTPPYKTPYWNFAPRIGVAYELSQSPRWERVVRGGFGVFYDLATQEFGNSLNAYAYPFGAAASGGGSFPLASASPPIIVAPSPSNPDTSTVFVFDPNLKLPYTLEWNLAVQQGLGTQQTLTATYTGATGKRLIGTASVISANATFPVAVQAVTNGATSNYNALQLQFNRRLSHGLQVLASYTWSHSIDTGSASSIGNAANGVTPGANPNQNRGDSDFDLRNKITLGLTYDIPAPRTNDLARALLKGWSVDTSAFIQSGPPVNVYDSLLSQVLNNTASVRPDVFPGIPLYLYGSQYPGGRAINFTPGAVAGGCPDGSTSVGPFCPPPSDSSGLFPVALRQGDLGRNALRGYRAAQWDFGVHREFPLRESLKIQFRAEMFNLLNHPNFAPPMSDISSFQFGEPTMTLGQYLGANAGSGGFSPLYQIGGPRSIQLALRVEF